MKIEDLQQFAHIVGIETYKADVIRAVANNDFNEVQRASNAYIEHCESELKRLQKPYVLNSLRDAYGFIIDVAKNAGNNELVSELEQKLQSLPPQPPQA